MPAHLDVGIYFGLKFFVSSLLTFCLVFFLLKLSLHSRIFLNPSKIPVVGGIAIGIVYSLTSLYFTMQQPTFSVSLIAIVLSGGLILLGGIWDDMHELSVTAKIVLQLIAVSALVGAGVRTHIVFLNIYANIAVTFFWVLAITNAFNLLDIMDGLCAAVTLVVAFGLFLICIYNGDVYNARLLAVVIGTAAGFLVFNLPAAKLYMGNAGSHYFGFVLAALSINISYASMTRQAALLSPLFIMGFPLFDTLFVALMRLKKGKSALQKSRDHLALRLLKLGHSQHNALLFMFSGAVVFSACGVLISQVSHATGVAIALAVMLAGSAVAWAMSKVSLDD